MQRAAPSLLCHHVAPPVLPDADRREDAAGQACLKRRKGSNLLGAVERGERDVRLADVFRIADALGVRPSEIHVRAESSKRRR